jgi:hypothetical protein
VIFAALSLSDIKVYCHMSIYTLFAALVKESEDDLKSPDDVYGAIGSLLKDVDSNKADEDIIEICEELFLLMIGYVENWLKLAELYVF